MSFNDYFSAVADEYAQYRPDYPTALFHYLATLVSTHELVWDCGTGNGQAAVALADYFKQVIATDPSEQQIKAAMPKDNVSYRVAPAEKSLLADHSVDLITVAQALHWFDFDKFYAEARRVLKPDGVIAAWCYVFSESVDPKIDTLINLIYTITTSHWAPARRYIDEKYQTIPFPFQRIATPLFYMEKQWNLTDLLNYIHTWSGLRAYIKATGINPLETHAAEINRLWGDAEEIKTVRFPLYLLAGKL